MNIAASAFAIVAIAACTSDERSADPKDEITLANGTTIRRLDVTPNGVPLDYAEMDVGEAQGALPAFPELRVVEPLHRTDSPTIHQAVYCSSGGPDTTADVVARSFVHAGWQLARDAQADIPAGLRTVRATRERFRVLAVVGQGQVAGCTGPSDSFVGVTLVKVF